MVTRKKTAAIGAKRVAIYLRESTTGQTTANQKRELEEVAERHGWNVVQVFSDNGISGAKGRKERPGLDALLKGVARRDFDLVAAWSVDRLGRSLQDLIEVLSDLHAKASTSTSTSKASTPLPLQGAPCIR
jgi:DNA invertase Pin-like site-specific DNA recombinase